MKIHPLLLLAILVTCRADVVSYNRRLGPNTDLGVTNDLNRGAYVDKGYGYEGKSIGRAGGDYRSPYIERAGLGQGVYVGKTRSFVETSDGFAYENDILRTSSNVVRNIPNGRVNNPDYTLRASQSYDRANNVRRASDAGLESLGNNLEGYAPVARASNVDEYAYIDNEGNYATRSGRLGKTVILSRTSGQTSKGRAVNLKNAVPVVTAESYGQGSYLNMVDDTSQGGNVVKISNLDIKTPNYDQLNYQVIDRTDVTGPGSDLIRTDLDKEEYLSKGAPDSRTDLERHGYSPSNQEIEYNRHIYVPTLGGSGSADGSNNGYPRGIGVPNTGYLDYNNISPDFESLSDTEITSSPRTISADKTFISPYNESTSSDISNGGNNDQSGISNRGVFGENQLNAGLSHRGFHNSNEDRISSVEVNDAVPIMSNLGEISYSTKHNDGSCCSSGHCNCENTNHNNCEGENCKRVTKTVTTTTCETCKTNEIKTNNCETCKYKDMHNNIFCESCKNRENNNNNYCGNCKFREESNHNYCEHCKFREENNHNYCEHCKFREENHRNYCEHCKFKEESNHNYCEHCKFREESKHNYCEHCKFREESHHSYCEYCKVREECYHNYCENCKVRETCHNFCEKCNIKEEHSKNYCEKCKNNCDISCCCNCGSSISSCKCHHSSSQSNGCNCGNTYSCQCDKISSNKVTTSCNCENNRQVKKNNGDCNCNYNYENEGYINNGGGNNFYYGNGDVNANAKFHGSVHGGAWGGIFGSGGGGGGVITGRVPSLLDQGSGSSSNNGAVILYTDSNNLDDGSGVVSISTSNTGSTGSGLGTASATAYSNANSNLGTTTHFGNGNGFGNIFSSGVFGNGGAFGANFLGGPGGALFGAPIG